MSSEYTFSLSPVESVDEVIEIWKSVEDHSHSIFFLSHHWMKCWLEAVKTKPYVFVARNEDNPIAIGFLQTTPPAFPFISPPITRLNQTGNREENTIYIEMNGLLCHSDYPDLQLQCWQWVREQAPNFQLERLSTNAYDAMKESFPNLAITKIDIAPFLNFQKLAQNNIPVLDSFSKNTRQQIRRAIKIYAAKSPIEIQRPENSEHANEYLDRLILFHQKTWQRRGEKGAFDSSFFTHFHKSLIKKSFQHGIIDLVKFSTQDLEIGYLYNFIYKNRCYSYQSGFNYSTDNRLKSGLLCHALIAEDYLGKGFDQYNFLAGDSRYKRSLSNDEEPLYSVNTAGHNAASILKQKIKSFFN